VTIVILLYLVGQAARMSFAVEEVIEFFGYESDHLYSIRCCYVIFTRFSFFRDLWLYVGHFAQNFEVLCFLLSHLLRLEFLLKAFMNLGPIRKCIHLRFPRLSCTYRFAHS
jgi:hypothetical protein